MVTASHDQTLKVWTFEGNCIATLFGHTALVYRCSSARQANQHCALFLGT